MVSLATVAWRQCTRWGQRKREVVAFAGAYLLSDYARYEIFQTAVLRCRAAAAACHRSGLLTQPLLVIVEWVMGICYPSRHENPFPPMDYEITLWVKSPDTRGTGDGQTIGCRLDSLDSLDSSKDIK